MLQPGSLTQERRLTTNEETKERPEINRSRFEFLEWWQAKLTEYIDGGGAFVWTGSRNSKRFISELETTRGLIWDEMGEQLKRRPHKPQPSTPSPQQEGTVG